MITFSDAYWPLCFSFLWGPWLRVLSIFKDYLGCFFSCLFEGVFHMFWIWTLSWLYILYISYLIHHVPIYFLNSVFLIARGSKFWLSPIYQCFPLMACTCLLNFFVYTKVMKIFPIFSSRIYVVLSFIFVSKIDLKLTFDYQDSFFPHRYPIAPAPFTENEIKQNIYPLLKFISIFAINQVHIYLINTCMKHHFMNNSFILHKKLTK